MYYMNNIAVKSNIDLSLAVKNKIASNIFLNFLNIYKKHFLWGGGANPLPPSGLGPVTGHSKLYLPRFMVLWNCRNLLTSAGKNTIYVRER